MKSAPVLLCLTLGICGCAPPVPATTYSQAPKAPVEDQTDAFRMRMIDEIAFAINVSVDGAPAPYARVQIVDALRVNSLEDYDARQENVASTELYFQGATSTSGWVEGLFRAPTGVYHFDVVILESEGVGEFSAEGLREAWGDFAPDARITVSQGDLAEMTIDLTRKP